MSEIRVICDRCEKQTTLVLDPKMTLGEAKMFAMVLDFSHPLLLHNERICELCNTGVVRAELEWDG